MPLRLNQSEDFFQMNAGAHRRRATNFTAPALIWHRAFWIEVPSSHQNPGLSVQGLEALRNSALIQLRDKIDDFIMEFRRFVLTLSGSPRCAVQPSVGKKVILFNRVVEAESFTRLV